MNSPFGFINWQQLVLGVVIAFVGVVFGGVQALAQPGQAFTWSAFLPYVVSGIGAAGAYIVHAFASNSGGEPFKKEPTNVPAS